MSLLCSHQEIFIPHVILDLPNHWQGYDVTASEASGGARPQSTSVSYSNPEL